MDLLHHLLLFVFDSHVFEVLPLGEDLHGLDVLDGGQFVPVVLVAAEGVQIHFLSEALVLPLDDLQDVGDLLTVVDFLVVDSYD